MSSICKVCAKVWAGPSLGRLYHCDSETIRKIDQSAEQPYKVKQIGERLSGRTVCECGQPAVRPSSCDARSSVCQRCHDCEIGGYGTRLAKSPGIETYAVRLPSWGGTGQ
jgi:hypothetical protein